MYYNNAIQMYINLLLSPLVTTTSQAMAAKESKTWMMFLMLFSVLAKGLSVSPCDDFNRYSCQTWKNNNPIPPEKFSRTRFDELGEQNDKMIYDLLMDSRFSSNSSSMIDSLKDHFQLCVKSYEKNNEIQVKEILKNLGGFPVLEDNWDEKSFTWIETVYKMNGMGLIYEIFFKTITESWRNFLKKPELGLDRKYYGMNENNAVVKAYKQLIFNTMVRLGANENTAKTDMEKVFNFEKDFANLKYSSSSHYQNMEERIRKIGFLNFGHYYKKTKGIKIRKDYYLTQSEYTQSVSLKYFLLNTSKRVISNYMMWRVVLSLMPFISPYFKNQWNDLQEKTGEIASQTVASKSCLDDLPELYKPALGIAYIDKYLPESIKNEVLEVSKQMTDLVLETAKISFRKLTKQNLLTLTSDLKDSITNVLKTLNNTKSQNCYKTLEIVEFKELEKLIPTIEKTEWPYDKNFEKQLLNDYDNFQQFSYCDTNDALSNVLYKISKLLDHIAEMKKKVVELWRDMNEKLIGKANFKKYKIKGDTCLRNSNLMLTNKNYLMRKLEINKMKNRPKDEACTGKSYEDFSNVLTINEHKEIFEFDENKIALVANLMQEANGGNRDRCISVYSTIGQLIGFNIMLTMSRASTKWKDEHGSYTYRVTPYTPLTRGFQSNCYQRNDDLHIYAVNPKMVDKYGVDKKYLIDETPLYMSRKLAEEKCSKSPKGWTDKEKHQFYKKSAYLWCGNYAPEFNVKIGQFNSSIGELVHINSYFGNVDMFSEDLKCPKSSPMNFKYKCSFWNQTVIPKKTV